MGKRERQTWLVVWLLCHTVGAVILTMSVFGREASGLFLGLGILIISAVVIVSLLDEAAPLPRREDSLVKNRNDDDSIPNELTQAIQNADTSSMRAALRSSNPGQLQIALESALALIDTLKSLVRAVLR